MDQKSNCRERGNGRTEVCTPPIVVAGWVRVVGVGRMIVIGVVCVCVTMVVICVIVGRRRGPRVS